MNVFKILCLLGLSLNWTVGQTLIDDDTVLLEDKHVVFSGRVRRETIRGPDGSTVTINCKTSRNEDGHCRPFGECYPLFRMRNADDGSQPFDLEARKANSFYELESIYRNVSGPCSPALLSQISTVVTGEDISSQEYVRCPDQKVVSRLRAPSRPPSTTSASNANCGRTYVGYDANGKAEEEASFYNATGSDEGDATTTSTPTDEDVEGRFIVNGVEARRGQFPWTVALMNRGRQFCGGSLISDTHILTAAHCVYFMNQNDVRGMSIHIGDHSLYSNSDGPHQVRKAVSIYYHRGFSMKTLYDDICVIRLSSPVTFNRNVSPVCLHSGSPKYDAGSSTADVAGWGRISLNGPPSSVLRAVKVRVMNQPECISKYRGQQSPSIRPGMVCAGDRGRDSCKGDSGGPLTLPIRSQSFQIGVVSWGIGCASFPGVYTRVDNYLPWINKNRR